MYDSVLLQACLLSLESYAGLNSLKPFILKLLMCDLDRFSKIQSHTFIRVVPIIIEAFLPYSEIGCNGLWPVDY